jgi:predicted MFS family arabinose efflux permease
MLNLVGIIGSLSITRISDKLAPSAVVAGGYGIGVVGVLGLSVTASLSPPIFLFSFVAGFFCIGAQMTLVSLSSAYYPWRSVRAASPWSVPSAALEQSPDRSSGAF